MDFLNKVVAALLLAIAAGAVSWFFSTQKTRLKRHVGSKHIKLLENWGPLIGITVGLSAAGTYLYFENKPDTTWQTQARSDFARLTLPQAILKCREWPNSEVRYQAPLAFAWQPQALDWYVLEAADNAAMRHYSCDGTGITTGKRYERAMLKRAPLTNGRPSAALEQNLFDVYTSFSDAGVRALEVAEDPQTGQRVERRWLDSGAVQLSDEQAQMLPVLLDKVPVDFAVGPYPQRTAQDPINWSKRPDAAFALLDKYVQPGQRIGQLYIAQKQIQATVVGPVEVAAQPAAPFGVLNFDAYGVADQAAWVPTLAGVNTCQQGLALNELKALLAQEPKPINLLYAWFDCDRTQAHGDVGAWYLRDARTRQEHLPAGRH